MTISGPSKAYGLGHRAKLWAASLAAGASEAKPPVSCEARVTLTASVQQGAGAHALRWLEARKAARNRSGTQIWAWHSCPTTCPWDRGPG